MVPGRERDPQKTTEVAFPIDSKQVSVGEGAVSVFTPMVLLAGLGISLLRGRLTREKNPQSFMCTQRPSDKIEIQRNSQGR